MGIEGENSVDVLSISQASLSEFRGQAILVLSTFKEYEIKS